MFTSKTIMKKCLDCCCAKTVTYTADLFSKKLQYSKTNIQITNAIVYCYVCEIVQKLLVWLNVTPINIVHFLIFIKKNFFLFGPRHGCFQVVLKISVLKRWGFLKNTKSHSDQHDFGKENKTVPGIWVDDKRCVGVHRIVSQYEVNACYPFQC